jgi:uncharacterized membrane protein
MPTIAGGRPRKIDLAPNRIDYFLAAASLVLLFFVLAAIVRGHDEWTQVSGIIWGHIATILIALVLTPLMLLRRRGDRLHRRVGRVWASSMALTAVLTFGIRGINEGGLSAIHALSGFTLIMVPWIIVSARRHQHASHRATVRAMVAGALLIAGFFTFPLERLMGHWLLG